ncbi:glycosyltransferase family 25 protein [soil metagenome]
MSAFIINLVEQSERREQMQRRLDALGLPHEFVDAVDGRKLEGAELSSRYDEKGAADHYRAMSRSEVGCALSHLLVYRIMIERNLPWALVLEDDAAPGDDVPAVLAALAARVDPDESSVVLLNHVDKYTRRGMTWLLDGYRLARPYGYWWRAHGYFITRGAARSLLAGLEPVTAAADHWIEFERRKLVTMRAVIPYCIGLSPLAEQSSIEVLRAEQVRRDPRPRTLRYRLHRIFYQRFLHQILVRPFLRVARQPRQRRP